MTASRETGTASNPSAYLSSWADELRARADRVRQLIGDAHWPSDGHHKEAILHEFLSRYLYAGACVSNGFVRSPAAEQNCSPEIDVLVSDSRRHPPLFSEGSLQIVSPSGVIGHISVKTNFARKELLSAVLNVARTQRTICKYANPRDVWRGIFFFEIPENRDLSGLLDTVVSALTEGIKTVVDETESPVARRALVDFVPTCICVLDRIVIFIRRAESNLVTLRLFDLGRLSAAATFSDLFGVVQKWNGRSERIEIEEMVASLSAGCSSLTRQLDLGVIASNDQ